MKIHLNPAEIDAFADKVRRAFLAQHEHFVEDLTIPDWTPDELLSELVEAVWIACGIDQVSNEYELLREADAALAGGEGGDELPPRAL
jgi:hypothetical protein